MWVQWPQLTEHVAVPLMEEKKDKAQRAANPQSLRIKTPMSA